MHSISQKIIKNTLYNGIGRIWGTIIHLILTPYIISRIGIERFGIWSILSVLIGYFSLIDLGISTSFVKYISEYHATNNYRKINEIINTGFFFYLFISIIIFSFAIIFTKFIISIFNIPSELQGEANIVFILGILLFAFSNTTSVFGAIQPGLQRMDILNKVAITISIFNAFGTIFFLENGYGLLGLMINNAIILTLNVIINIIIGFSLLPALKLNPFFCRGDVFRKLFSFGWKLQLSRLASLVSFQTDKVLISHFLGVSLVTNYHIGATIVHKMREIPLLLVSALVPASSEIAVHRGNEFLKEFHLKASKYLILITTPFLLFVVTNSKLIINSWMGKGYEQAAIAAMILAVGYYANSVSAVASSIAQGIARTDLEMKFGAFLATVNFMLSLILIVKIGFLGVVIGTSISLTFGSLFFMRMFHQIINCPSKYFLNLFKKPFLTCIVPVIIMIILNGLWPKSYISGRLVNACLLILNAFIFFGIYIVLILKSNYLDKYDIEIAKRLPLIKSMNRARLYVTNAI